MNRIPEWGTFYGDLITDTNAVSGQTWSHVAILEATVFTTLTGQYAVHGTLSGATFPAGIIIAGNFTEIQLTSGAVYAMRSKDA